MRILGIDPGLRTTGYGVVDKTEDDFSLVEAGIVQTKTGDKISERLLAIHEGIDSLIKDHKPEVMVLEKLFSHTRHPATAILMGHARGVICLLAGIYKIPIVNIPSTRVKKIIVTHGHASKDQVARAVARILNLKREPKPVDVTDALAVAISYGSSYTALNPLAHLL